MKSCLLLPFLWCLLIFSSYAQSEHHDVKLTKANEKISLLFDQLIFRETQKSGPISSYLGAKKIVLSKESKRKYQTEFIEITSKENIFSQDEIAHGAYCQGTLIIRINKNTTKLLEASLLVDSRFPIDTKKPLGKKWREVIRETCVTSLQGQLQVKLFAFQTKQKFNRSIKRLTQR